LATPYEYFSTECRTDSTKNCLFLQ